MKRSNNSKLQTQHMHCAPNPHTHYSCTNSMTHSSSSTVSSMLSLIGQMAAGWLLVRPPAYHRHAHRPARSGPICGRPFSDPCTRRGGHVKIRCKKKHGQAFYSKFYM